ncbi:MAG TPA: L,D-transpeptidase [Longimicrobiales bacterium]|nr:L,D-transpeptidase [Longimicrobiales bacterium]
MKFLRIMAISALVSGCASIPIIGHKKQEEEPGKLSTPDREVPFVREVAASHPRTVKPDLGSSTAIYDAALKQPGMKIIVSRRARSLWLMRDTTMLFRAPVAIGRSKSLVWEGKVYDFNTPVGKRKVLGKGTTPLWTPPNWHYYEVAQRGNLQPVFLKKNSKITLLDSTRIEVRGNQVGRVNRFGNFWPFTPGIEIVFDRKVFVPPVGTEQRRIPEVLGTHKLEMGSGYLIHGTDEEGSIGEAVSHGCVRMYNEDVAHLYDLVTIGTPVYIY